MRLVKADEPLDNIFDDRMSVFLGGGMTDWRAKTIEYLKDTEVTVVDPTWVDWDSSWTATMSNAHFRERVEWELEAQEICDMKVFCFEESTKAPVSMLELGLSTLFDATDWAKTTLVYCDEGFWKKGNIDIVCWKFGMQSVGSLEELMEELKDQADKWYSALQERT